MVSPCPSVCPSIRPSVHLSVDRIVSALYLLQYSPDPFHIYTSYQATLEGVSRVKCFSEIKRFVTLTLSCFDLGSNMNWSIVWVIMGQPGWSSECRHCCCSGRSWQTSCYIIYIHTFIVRNKYKVFITKKIHIHTVFRSRLLKLTKETCSSSWNQWIW